MLRWAGDAAPRRLCGAALIFALVNCAEHVARAPAEPAPANAPSTSHPASSALGRSPGVPDPPLETPERVRRRLLEEQDTNCDQRISGEDQGSKHFRFGFGGQAYELSGSYLLSNLLSELSRLSRSSTELKAQRGSRPALDLDRVLESPIEHVSRQIHSELWDALTRSLDETGLPRLLDAPGLGRGPERILYVANDDAATLQAARTLADRYNASYRRLTATTADLPLLRALGDAAAEEQSADLLALSNGSDGSAKLAELSERLAPALRELGYPALSQHLERELVRARELAARAELPCVRRTPARSRDIARRIARALASFQPHALSVRTLSPLPDRAAAGLAAPRAARGWLAFGLTAAPGKEVSGMRFLTRGDDSEQASGWESYFILLGLLQDQRLDLAQSLVDDVVYMLEHYGTVLHGNRSQYLGRTELPFTTTLIRTLWDALPPVRRDRAWLRRALGAALLEYQIFWAASERQPAALCRGEADGRVCLVRSPISNERLSSAPESGQFERVWSELGHSLQASYAAGRLSESNLGAAFESALQNDRCMRASGQDSTYRWFWPAPSLRAERATAGSESSTRVPGNRCSEMISLDLNSLLYKSELDIAYLSEQLGDDASHPGAPGEHDQEPHSNATSTAPLPNDPSSWCLRAAQRFALLEQLLWDPAQGLFFDAFVGAGGVKRTGYVSASTFYPLWASAEACRAGGVASAVPLTRKERALLVTSALAALEAPGGVLASARASRERFSPNGDRGWDYPNGWAPQQMLAWRALEAHGFHQDAERLAFSWLYLLLSHAIGHGGDLLESYDVVQREAPSTTGLDARAVPDPERSSFAWTAASFQVGLALLDAPEKARLAEAVASAGH